MANIILDVRGGAPDRYHTIRVNPGHGQRYTSQPTLFISMVVGPDPIKTTYRELRPRLIEYRPEWIDYHNKLIRAQYSLVKGVVGPPYSERHHVASFAMIYKHRRSPHTLTFAHGAIGGNKVWKAWIDTGRFSVTNWKQYMDSGMYRAIDYGAH